MRALLALGCTAALFVVAACNGGADAPVANDRKATAGNAATAEPTVNAVGNAAGPVDVAAFMHDRHERYEDIGDAMKGINRELKGGSPSIARVQRHAAQIAHFAPQVPSLFPPGTGPETGRRTRAKAEIWSDPQTFRQRAEAFRTQATRFNRAAQSGDIAAVRAALPDLAKSCKNCHDRFRGPEIEH
jgi:cytochrome c556